jgi:hypothetical protein
VSKTFAAIIPAVVMTIVAAETNAMNCFALYLAPPPRQRRPQPQPQNHCSTTAPVGLTACLPRHQQMKCTLVWHAKAMQASGNVKLVNAVIFIIIMCKAMAIVHFPKQDMNGFIATTGIQQ